MKFLDVFLRFFDFSHSTTENMITLSASRSTVHTAPHSVVGETGNVARAHWGRLPCEPLVAPGEHRLQSVQYHTALGLSARSETPASEPQPQTRTPSSPICPAAHQHRHHTQSGRPHPVPGHPGGPSRIGHPGQYSGRHPAPSLASLPVIYPAEWRLVTFSGHPVSINAHSTI